MPLSRNILFVLLGFLIISFLFLATPKIANAQQCSGSKTVTQTKYSCSFNAVLNRWTCPSQSVTTTYNCAPDIDTGQCFACVNNNDTVGCSIPSDGSSCVVLGGGQSCDASVCGGGNCNSNGNCLAPGLTCCTGQSHADASCPTTGTRCGPAGSVPPPGGTWGPCGGCSPCAGPNGECQRHPDGSCVWNPTVCTSGWSGCIPQCNPGQAGIGSGAGHCGQNPAQSCPYNGYDCGFGQGNCVGAQSCCNGLVKDGSGNCQCPPAPTCTVVLSPDPSTVSAGGQSNLTANITSIQNGVVGEVRFSTSNSGVATASTPDTVSPYITTTTGVSAGSVTVTADVYISGQRVCSDNSVLNVTPPRGWWQVRDGDVVTNGALQSLIPTTCTAPCSNRFILDGVGGYPGVGVYGSSYDFSAGVTTGTASSKNWLAQNTVMPDAGTVWFVSHDASENLTCAGGSPCFTGSSIKLCWGKAGTSPNDSTTPAIEASIYYANTPGNYSTIRIARGAFDPNSTRTSTNSFTGADPGTCTIDGTAFPFQKTINFADLGIPAGVYNTPNGLQMLRVKMLYNTSPHPFGVDATGGSNFPSQALKVESSGGSQDANRKVEVIKNYADLPPIFDSAVLSPSGIVK